MIGEGTVLDRKLRLVRPIGSGGMGVVWEAEHLLIRRQVAVKLLHEECVHDRTLVERFHREARAAGAIGHLNIVDVFDLGIGPGGIPYLVMELLRGEPFSARMRREGRIAPPRAVDVVGQALAGVGAAHAKGILHRDLKPENLFLTEVAGRRDFVKVLDFGVSKLAESCADPRLTETGMAMGTPHYMAPEQAAGFPEPDHRADVYALSAVLYEALCGHTPYQGRNYNELLARIITSDPIPLAERVPDLDPGLVTVVERGMARDPDTRWPTAEAMLQALLLFGAHRHAFDRPRSEPPPPEKPETKEAVAADPEAGIGPLPGEVEAVAPTPTPLAGATHRPTARTRPTPTPAWRRTARVPSPEASTGETATPEPAGEGTTTQAPEGPEIDRTTVRSRRRRAGWLVAGLLAAGALLGLFLLRPDAEATAPPPHPPTDTPTPAVRPAPSPAGGTPLAPPEHRFEAAANTPGRADANAAAAPSPPAPPPATAADPDAGVPTADDADAGPPHPQAPRSGEAAGTADAATTNGTAGRRDPEAGAAPDAGPATPAGPPEPVVPLGEPVDAGGRIEGRMGTSVQTQYEED